MPNENQFPISTLMKICGRCKILAHQTEAGETGFAHKRCGRLARPVCYTFLEEEDVLDTRFLDELNRKVSELIAASPAKDIEKNVRALLSSAFSRLDLVTREEFDVQREVLARTRAKLEEMEARLAELEKSLADSGKG